MRFGLLGTLSAVSEEGPVDLGPRKQRLVLAVLLIHANEIVSTDRIIEMVWGEEAPRTASHSVQIYVSDLRKALSNGKADLIETCSPGYRLNVDPEAIDSRRFARLASEGVSSVRDGDLGAGKSLLEEALDEWQADPLAEFSYEEFAIGHIRYLEELRLDALQALAVVHLDQGRDDEARATAREAIEADPLREEPRRLMMLALYRSGRQAEALRHYGAYRDLLADELGILPSEVLRDLEERILLQDPTLDSGGSASAATTLLILKLTGQPPDIVAWFDGRGDGSFGDLVASGLDLARDSHGAVAAEFVGEVPQLDEIRQTIKDGASLAFFQSADLFESPFQSSLVELISGAPETRFVLIDCPFKPEAGQALPPFEMWPRNLGCISAANEEMGFVAGVAAALASSSGRVGFIGGVDFDLIWDFQCGFEQGVAHVEPSHLIEQVYLADDFSGFTSPALGHAAAGFLSRRGVDVIFHASGGSGRGVFRWTAQEYMRTGRPTLTIGVDVDQSAELKQNQQIFGFTDEELDAARFLMVTSVRKRLDLGILETVRQHLENETAQTLVMNAANGGVDYTKSDMGVQPYIAQMDEAIGALASDLVLVDKSSREPTRMLLDQLP